LIKEGDEFEKSMVTFVDWFDDKSYIDLQTGTTGGQDHKDREKQAMVNSPWLQVILN
jgi:hypothetical protein